MLRWLRARAGAVAPALLLALCTLALPHVDVAGHDHDSRLPTVVVHDASNHTVGAPATSDNARPDHCAICHWTRTFQPQTRVAALAASATEPVERSHVEESTPVSSSVAVQPPLRAPPSSPAFA